MYDLNYLRVLSWQEATNCAPQLSGKRKEENQLMLGKGSYV